MSSGKRWKRPWVHDMLRFMSTDARVIARQYYATYGRNMCSDISALQANPQGVVLFTPFVVAMLKPIRTDEDLLWMDLAQSPPNPDGWYVHLLCGDLSLARLLAYRLRPLRWLIYQRGVRGTGWRRCLWKSLLP